MGVSVEASSGETAVLVIKAGFDRTDKPVMTYEYLPVPEPETEDAEEEDKIDEAA